MTLGSLFDGIGGFPLAGVMCGITPVWASEIEPFPMKVTAARFPEMKQLGDIRGINGAEIEPVDIITFGSPCQDLSVAGKQAGIHDGKRSNLFFEAIRVIKEMRDADKARGRTDVQVRPRFAVWENVPGAFSSNKGEDFKAVLQAFAGVMEDGLDVPGPPKGRWNHAGGVAGDGWSVAWRVYDAQYWGVPQRRKRIYLIADFAGERAGEILFERESVCGDSEAGGEARQGASGDAEGSAGRSCGLGCLNPWDVQSKHIMTPDGKSEALCSGEKRWGGLASNILYSSEYKAGQRASEVKREQNVVCYAPNGNHCGNYDKTNVSATLETGYHYGSGGDAVLICDGRGNGDGKTAPTMAGDHFNRPGDYSAILVEKNE